MKTITSILGESLAATLVIIVCLSLPSLLGLPIWTLPFFGVPAMLYLDWRLGQRRWARWKIVRWFVGMSLFLPASLSSDVIGYYESQLYS